MQACDDRRTPLDAARVLLVGLGGLGSPAALALADAGVGTLGLVDPDCVELSNLPRQLLYDEHDIGRRKIDAARARLARGRPWLRIETRAVRFEATAAAWLQGFDVVLDGTDGAAAKFALNDAAVAAGVPLVHAGASGLRVQLLTVLPGRSACLRCLFEDGAAFDDGPACTAAGVLGPVVALGGGLAAAEALRLVTGAPALFADRLLTIDVRAGTWRSVRLARNPTCAACGGTHARAAAPRSAAR
jgi:adenylyltransferase/sulfurtransferase